MTAILTANPDGAYEVEGQTIAMPVRVGHARQAAATFLVPRGPVERLLEPTRLKPAKQGGKRAMVSLALVDYLENDLGTYKELALAILVDDPAGSPPKAKGSVSTYIHRLPVSEEFTCAAGKGIWGFPKWVADLDVHFHEHSVHCQLNDAEGHMVLSVEMLRGPLPIPRRPLPMVAYTCDDEGVVRRTPWDTNGTGSQRIRPGGTRIEIGYGHPIADELRSLGLTRRPLMTMWDDHMSATFGSPEVVDI